MKTESFLEQAACVRPNRNQLRLLQETPFYVFVHFSTNTFTDLELGTGRENPAIFNPEKLNCEQWARAVKAAGAKGLVLTAKHHDGFCLWQSAYTEHCMKNSPYKNGKGDVVREAADACRKYGLRFGFYLSPWDRNSPYYGTPEYNAYFKNQLTELLTNYGEIFHVWFDGCCGEGPNGKKQTYDFEGYIELIRKYQPNATFFHDAGEVRWCGNESGSSGHAQWSVVPKELCFLNHDVQTGAGPLSGDLAGLYNTDSDLGTLPMILCSEGLVFSPAETDMSIRPGWFWHEKEEPHSLERLFDTYIRTVGGNMTFNLNVPPNREGLFDARDVRRLEELGQKIRDSFSENLAKDAQITVTENGTAHPSFTLRMPQTRKISYVVLQEKIEEGQRVELFSVYEGAHVARGAAYTGTTIGSKKIIPLTMETDAVTVQIRAARGPVEPLSIELY